MKHVFGSGIALAFLCASCGSSSSSPASPPSNGGSAGSGGAAGSTGGGGDGGGGFGGVIYGAGGFNPAGGAGGSMLVTCAGYFANADGTQTGCQACGATQCCDEAMTCLADSACSACIAEPVGHGCDVVKNPAPAWQALAACLTTAGVTAPSGPCADACSSTKICNPVTNAGCDGTTTCDVESSGSGRCFDAGPAPVCGACDTAKGIYCGPTLHCLASKACARFCCGDEDCGSGRCVSWPLGGGSLGVCIAGASGEEPACDAPESATSAGVCAN